MKMTNAQLVANLSFLNSVADKYLPQKISFTIAKNIKLLSDIYTVYEHQLKKIVDKNKNYIEKTEAGGLNIKEGGEDAANEIKELLHTENDIQLCKILPDSLDYDDTKYDSFSAAELLDLQKIMCD